jgi:hypothetical protein
MDVGFWWGEYVGKCPMGKWRSRYKIPSKWTLVTIEMDKSSSGLCSISDSGINASVSSDFATIVHWFVRWLGNRTNAQI